MAKKDSGLGDPTVASKLLWVKFGWSEYYRGESVDGNFGWLKARKGGKDEGRGHEAFNFVPGDDGTYYCYVPPQSSKYAPQSEDNKGWTVICLAKNPNHTGIHIVGWYEDATLLGKWQKLPANHPAAGFAEAGTAYSWSYCISSKSVFFFPPEARVTPFSHSSIRQGKYSFLKGPEVKHSANKEQVLSIFQAQFHALKGHAVHNPTSDNSPDPELDSADPLNGFGTPEHRKKVEKAAEAVVIAHFKQKNYKCANLTKLNCGYDYRFSKKNIVFDVEVKGTSSKNMAFFLTKNEHDQGMKGNPNWRLAMVTDALGDKPLLRLFDGKELIKAFDLAPYVYIGKGFSETY